MNQNSWGIFLTHEPIHDQKAVEKSVNLWSFLCMMAKSCEHVFSLSTEDFTHNTGVQLLSDVCWRGFTEEIPTVYIEHKAPSVTMLWECCSVVSAGWREESQNYHHCDFFHIWTLTLDRSVLLLKTLDKLITWLNIMRADVHRAGHRCTNWISFLLVSALPWFLAFTLLLPFHLASSSPHFLPREIFTLILELMDPVKNCSCCFPK